MGIITKILEMGLIGSSTEFSSSCRRWHTIPRSNPSQDYPSDFSVIHLMSGDDLDCVRALKSYPAVTPHYKLSHSLSCSNSPESITSRRNMLEQPLTGDKWIVGRRLLRAIPRQITSALHADVLYTCRLLDTLERM